jgi:hypothetical protein
VQAWSRGALVKKKYRMRLISHLEVSGTFRSKWSDVMGLLLKNERLCDSVWSSVREGYVYMTRSKSTDLSCKLEDALREAMNDDNDDTESEECDRRHEDDCDVADGSLRINENDDEFRLFLDLSHTKFF